MITFGEGRQPFRAPTIRKLREIAETCGARFHYLDHVRPLRWYFSTSSPDAPDLIRSKVREMGVAGEFVNEALGGERIVSRRGTYEDPAVAELFP